MKEDLCTLKIFKSQCWDCHLGKNILGDSKKKLSKRKSVQLLVSVCGSLDVAIIHDARFVKFFRGDAPTCEFCSVAFS